MSLELSRENMLLFFPSWEKPLSDKEITDFLSIEVTEETRPWYPGWIKDLPRLTVDKPVTKRYTTKKEIKQDIKIINDQLDIWLEHRRTAPNEISQVYADIHLEDYLAEKEKLQAKLRYTGVKFENNDVDNAKSVPLSNFLDFNSAGFTKCLWHDERTPSLHKITNKNKVYCFGCTVIKDVIDVVMEQNGCSLPEALKIILG